MAPNSTYNLDIRTRLKDALNNPGFTQKQFAKDPGKRASNFCGIIRRKRIITNDLLSLISERINEVVLRDYQDRRSFITKIKGVNPIAIEDYAQKTLDKFGAIVSVKFLIKGISDVKDTASPILELAGCINGHCSLMPQIELGHLSCKQGNYRFTNDVWRLIINKGKKGGGYD